MTETLVSAAALVLMLFIAGVGIWKIVTEIKNDDEYKKIRKELEYEVYHGGNVNRIAQLRARLLELEEGGCRRR